ncbi:MAG: hypothetical protein V9H25_01655 [Candidatus Competibacter sp.]
MAWVALFLWVCGSLPLLFYSQLGVDQKSIATYSIVMQIISPIMAGLICFGTAGLFPKSHEIRKVWKLLGAGVMLWGIGAIFYLLYPLINAGQETPYPWYSDFWYLIMYLPCLSAFVIFKQYLNVKVSSWGILVSAVVFCGTLALSVYLNLEKLGDSDTVLTYLVTLGYVLGDPILLGSAAIIASILGGAGEARPWWFVLIGFFSFYFANVTYTYLTLAGGYTSGNLIDIGWILGFGFIAVAALIMRSFLKSKPINLN